MEAKEAKEDKDRARKLLKARGKPLGACSRATFAGPPGWFFSPLTLHTCIFAYYEIFFCQ